MKYRLLKMNHSAYMLPLLAGMLWGTNGTSQAFAPAGTSPLAVGAMRITAGSFFLLAYALWKGELGEIRRPWPVGLIILAAAGISLCQLLFFAAVASTGVAAGTMVSMGSAPLIAGLLGLIFHREKITRRWLLSTALAIAGCILISSTGRSGAVNGTGITLALGAGASYAVYTTASKHLYRTQPMTGILAVIFCCGTLILLPVFFMTDMTWLYSLRGVTLSLHLGLVTTALAFLLFAVGLKKLPAATAATLGLAEPLTAALLGAVILGERLALPSWLGILAILAGLAILTTTPVTNTPAGSTFAMECFDENCSRG